MSTMRWLWGLPLLALWLLQGCVASLEALPLDGASYTEDSTGLCGKRFSPGRSKPPAQPSKPPANGSASKDPRESHNPRPSYKVGESDGGPGQWEQAPVRPKGASYQKDITGAPEGVEYAVPAGTSSGKVLFDGYRNGKLLDAKDWEQWPPVNAEFWQRGVREEARRQLEAARGTPIEWHFPNEDKARAVRAVFEEAAIRGIDVKVTRKQ